MRSVTALTILLFAFLLTAGEERLWRVAVPHYLLRDAGPALTTLDVVSVTDEASGPVFYLWERAERLDALGDLAAAAEPLSLVVDEAPAYRTLDEIESALYAMEQVYPEHAKVYTIGASIEGRDILALKLSVSPGEDLPGPPEVILVGLHHAREWISAEVTLRIAEFLAGHVADMPRIRSIVEGSELWFIPVLNPDGYLYTHTTDRMWRYNRRPHNDGSFGVDLNRNYDAAWVENGTVHGSAPFSEPETQALRDLIVTPEGGVALTDLPRGLISYHSYAQLILYPWSSQPDPAPTAELMRATGERMADLMLEADGAAYAVKQAYGLYAAPIFGECGEWFYTASEQGLPLLIELRPVTVEEGGFRLDPIYIEPSATENIAAALYFIESIMYDTVDINIDLNDNGEIDYLEVPDALTTEDEDALAGDDMIMSDDDVILPDDGRPLPRLRGGGCAISAI